MQNILHHTKSYYFAITWIKLNTLFLTNVCMYSRMYLVQNTTKFNSDTVCTYLKCKHFIELLTLTHYKITTKCKHFIELLASKHYKIQFNSLQKIVSHCKHFIEFLITMSAVGAMMVFSEFYMKFLFQRLTHSKKHTMCLSVYVSTLKNCFKLLFIIHFW